jgi:hypothetical protein
MISPQDLGRFFENKVHEMLERYLRNTNILREKDVKSNYGVHNSAVDHLLITYNTIICIQSKWENSAATLSKVNHFLMTVNNIAMSKFKDQTIGAIYLSKLPITKNAKVALDANIIETINVHDTNMDNIIEKLLTYIHFKYKMWSYDYDQNIIMR